MIVNKKMEKLIQQAKKYKKNNKLTISLKDLSRLFNPNFVKVFDCIIIADKNENKKYLETRFDKSIEYLSGKIAYEIWYAETRIDDYIECKISKEETILIGLMIIDIWSLKLKNIDNNSKFCIIMSYDNKWNGSVTLVYHKIRNNESLGISEDIESYNGPIGYAIV
ncbi:MAG: hypothetical protein LBT51_01775 [Fusobacteriaceae bacterium]|jgi:hypothetical protein|nr:hypothetical protein [Fusobacteriaceae bacterium]